jgi:hypothetical protein
MYRAAQLDKEKEQAIENCLLATISSRYTHCTIALRN